MKSPRRDTVLPIDRETWMVRIANDHDRPLRGTMMPRLDGVDQAKPSRQFTRQMLRAKAFNEITALLPNEPRRKRRLAARLAAAATMRKARTEHEEAIADPALVGDEPVREYPETHDSGDAGRLPDGTGESVSGS